MAHAVSAANRNGEDLDYLNSEAHQLLLLLLLLLLRVSFSISFSSFSIFNHPRPLCGASNWPGRVESMTSWLYLPDHVFLRVASGEHARETPCLQKGPSTVRNKSHLTSYESQR